MSETYTQSELKNAVPSAPLTHIDEVHLSMRDLGAVLTAEQHPLRYFNTTYANVTEAISQGIEAFEDTRSLNIATGKFYHRYGKQVSAFADGRMDNIEPHWKDHFSELAHMVPPAVAAVAGYASHIGGDLAQTPLEAGASEIYIKRDFPRVNGFLSIVAQKEAIELIPSLENDKIRKGLTHLAMGGIRAGRWQALRTYKRLEQAKSEDEKESIIVKSQERTAKFVNAIFLGGYALRTARIQMAA